MITQKQFSPRSGFTLIELLVVVLIIGILSAVALPQYTKAVEKARMTEAFSNIKTMQDNIDLYLLENGGFPTNMPYKDIPANTELSGGQFDENSYDTKNFSYRGSCWQIACDIQADRLSDNFFYTLYVTRDNDGWTKSCFTQLEDGGRQICKSLSGQGWTYRDGEI
ncbi:type IV pilin protein [Candidatus Avelusimicrobium stercoris]|uniref:type IV pilin protein n=1 Tax=Candidatus Avelusimicrobium stercoris TaxID=1947924 RepID=UPI003D0F99AE